MSLSARLTFSQIGLFVSILVYLIVRGFFVVINIGLLWTQANGYFAFVFPPIPVIVLGFTSCVISYSYSYLGLWIMDKGKYIPGAIVIFLSVIIAPGALGAYSWIYFPVLT